MAWTVARGSAIGFSLVMLALIADSFISYWNTRRVHEQDLLVSKTRATLVELKALVSALKDAETGQRGYLIVGDPRYLEPYKQAQSKILEHHQHLSRIFADNPEQLNRLAALKSAIDERLAVLDRNLSLRRDEGFEAAREGVRTRNGRRLMDEVRRQVDAITAHENAILSRRQAEAQSSYRIAVVTNLMGLALAAGVMTISWFLIRRELLRRIEATRIARVQRERLLTTLTSIGDAVIVTDSLGRVTLMNRVAEALTGWKGEAIGKPLEEVFRIVSEQSREVVESPVAKVLREGSIVGLANHTLLLSKDGQEHPIDDSGAPIRNEQGKIVGVVLVFRDIAQRRAAEQAQSRLLAELQEADRRKDYFLAMLAHELRNPLAPLSNALELWPRVEDDPAEMENLRKMMERQLQYMVRLIDDLLDMSRITRGKVSLRRQPVEISTAVRGAIEGVAPLIERSEHELVVEIPDQPLLVDGDVARLVQVFGNILHNAAKYCDRNGRICIRAEREGGDVVVKIRDNGPGIPKEMLSYIFEIFTQVDQTLDRAHGGLGIGLTLVKNLVELHGGSVTAHSDGPGTGSEFVVRLPALSPDQSAKSNGKPGDNSATHAALPRYRILVVDDVAASAATLAMMLKAIGQDAGVCHDGASAIAAVLADRPDMVIMDIGMPDMDGYEVARRLRQHSELDGIMLVALTGYGQEEDRRRALEAGFDHHLVKPASMDTLEELLARLNRRTPRSEPLSEQD